MNSRMALAEKFGDVTMFRTCEQCGCCSSACPIMGVNGFNVRRIVRHVELDLIEEIADTSFPWACTTCGRCESVCPNGIAILDIIRPLRAMSPKEYVPEGPAPCRLACPGGIDVPGYLRLIAQGKPGEAYGLILESVPFPGILGRVCVHPCESVCRRGEVNQAISICALKRYAADKAEISEHHDQRQAAETGRKVAIIGAGPAGLTAAYFLRKKGHEVTVLEARDKAGGMMRYAIPAFRLPEEVLDREINHILSLGVELKPGQKLGEDFTLTRLRQEGYEAIFVALGLQRSKRIDLEGSRLDGVFWGLEFLNRVREGDAPPLKDRVLVVGGGNVAVDVALAALRLGAKEVIMASLESRQEMPASPWEVEMALEEGVRLMPSWGPKRILGDDGKVMGIELVRCSAVFDEKGNFCPAFEDEVESVPVDQVVLAIGQTTDLSCLEGEEACTLDRGLIAVDPQTLETSVPGVFAGGEVATGPGALIEAVSSGKRAAGAIDRFLGGDGALQDPSQEMRVSDVYNGKREKGFSDLDRSGRVFRRPPGCPGGKKVPPVRF
jgi:NADPH-dependent glutamate synthase beta subunit-like oxidoreductase